MLYVEFPQSRDADFYVVVVADQLAPPQQRVMHPFSQKSLGNQSIRDEGIVEFLGSMKESWLNEIDIVFILAILHQYGVYCGHFDSNCQCYLLLRVQGFHFHPSIEASVAELDNLFDLEW